MIYGYSVRTSQETLLLRYGHQLVNGAYGKKSLFSVRPILYTEIHLCVQNVPF
jgi:hypothetical protein